MGAVSYHHVLQGTKNEHQLREQLAQADKLITTLRREVENADQTVQNKRLAIKNWCDKESSLLHEVRTTCFHPCPSD